MNVWIFNYASITDKGTNPRLLGYYRYLKKQGTNPCFFFLKRSTPQGTYEVREVRTNISWLAAFVQAVRILRCKTNPVIYVYGSHFVFLPVYIACKIKGLSLIIEKTELDSIKPTIGFKDLLNKWLYKLDEWLSPVFASKIVVISQRLEKYYSSKHSSVVLTGAFVPYHSLKDLPLPGNKHKTVIGYLGSFGFKDDLETLLSAYSQLHKEQPDVLLKLMGKIPAKYAYLKSAPGILCLDEIDSDQISMELSSCDVLVAIRRNIPYADYGFPSKLAEYLATSRPVICSKSSDIPDLLTDQNEVLLIDPESPDQLLSALQRLIRDEKEAKQMGQRGYDWAMNFWHPDHILKQWFEQVIS